MPGALLLGKQSQCKIICSQNWCSAWVWNEQSAAKKSLTQICVLCRLQSKDIQKAVVRIGKRCQCINPHPRQTIPVALKKRSYPKIAKHKRRHKMKATGIVRRIDDLGRVVIPKEIRRTMRIREGDPSLITLTQDIRFCMSVESAAERYIGK